MTPDAPFTLWDIAKWLGSALVAVCLWALGLFKKRIEVAEVSHAQLVEKVGELELNTVSRDTHQRHEADTRDALDAMLRESIAREDRIISEIRGLGTRIDNLFQERRG